MKHTPHKTTVSTLRRFIESEMKKAGRPERFSQESFAELIEKSPATVASLENGRLALSTETAKVISDKTGISFIWLLSGKPEAPMREAPGLYTEADREAERQAYWASETKPEAKPSSARPYTLQSYDRASFNREKAFGLAAVAVSFGFDAVIEEIREMKKAWSSHPDGEFRLWKLKKAVERVRAEFRSEG